MSLQPCSEGARARTLAPTSAETILLMNMYKPVPKVPDFPTMEREMLRFWQENRIFDKLREQNANGPRWSFLDGPITANNPMGVHHAWGRSLKDMYQRYHAMNGQAERYQNGFDCQGLWVEVEVEKSLGLKTKREIRDYGIEKFVRACKERVLTYAARQTEQSIRLGYWCDWDDPEVLIALRDALADGDRVVTVKLPSGRVETARASEIVRKLGSAEYGGSYFTFSDENNYTIWGFLKKCHDQGFIYRGTTLCRGADAAAPASRRWKWRKAVASRRILLSSFVSLLKARRRQRCWCGRRLRGHSRPTLRSR